MTLHRSKLNRRRKIMRRFRLTEFDGAVHAQQDVVTLDVSMDHLI